VRILRVARFAARYASRGFKVAHATNKLMRQMVESGEVDALVPERVWQETEGALGETSPARFFEVLRGCDALQRVFPEIDALFGVPQPETPHPEKDTGIHALMVLDQAAAMTGDTRVRFAALLHDLGKGDTPQEEWPHHIGHEQRGVELVQALCRRLRAPNDYRDLAMLTARYHNHCHRATELRPGTLLKALEGLDAFRKPERLELFLIACEADARGRKGKQDQPYPQADIFRRAHAAASAVDVAQLLQRGLEGEAIRSGLERLRIEAIKAIV
jgi:tRNA nucleotidyltransferase (CCA-adding enzyme)